MDLFTLNMLLTVIGSLVFCHAAYSNNLERAKRACSGHLPHSYREKGDITLIECCVRCHYENTCKSISYMSGKGTCMLNDELGVDGHCVTDNGVGEVVMYNIKETGKCRRCFASGINLTGNADCCPYSQTCDNTDNGVCVSAEVDDTGNTTYPCQRVTFNGDLHWCHYGATCTMPDGTGQCRKVKTRTTAEDLSTLILETPTVKTPSTAMTASSTSATGHISTNANTSKSTAISSTILMTRTSTDNISSILLNQSTIQQTKATRIKSATEQQTSSVEITSLSQSMLSIMKTITTQLNTERRETAATSATFLLKTTKTSTSEATTSIIQPSSTTQSSLNKQSSTTQISSTVTTMLTFTTLPTSRTLETSTKFQTSSLPTEATASITKFSAIQPSWKTTGSTSTEASCTTKLSTKITGTIKMTTQPMPKTMETIKIQIFSSTTATFSIQATSTMMQTSAIQTSRTKIKMQTTQSLAVSPIMTEMKELTTQQPSSIQATPTETQPDS